MDSYDFSPSPLEYPHASSSSSGSSSSSQPPPPPEKKKRKQNQACDACKSRRVKCDLADLPPDSSCTKCASKGIQCTSILNSTRAPAKRTGPRIEEAKRLYGSADSMAGTVVQSGGEGAAAAAGGGQLFQNQAGLATLTVYGVAPARTLPQVALSQAVERDLLEVYFRSAHFGVQAIDPTEFRRKYNDAGQLSQYMSEGNQVLCSVMCAWGARYSENPYILPAGSKSLPHSQVGQTREPICEILLERAQTMLDTFGTLRKPSKEAVEALILLAPLVEYKHETRNLRMRTAVDPSHAEETRLLEGIMAEHVEALGLWDDAQVVGFERSERRGEGGELVEVELTGDVIASQMKSQRLLWCSWIWDSFRTAAGRKAPRFSDDAIFEICPHIPRLGNPLPKVSNLSDAQCFLLLVSSYPMMGELLRYAGKHITVPSLKKRNSQPFEELEKSCRVFWRAMDDFAAWFDSVAQRLLGVFPTLSTFSPISWYVSIKLAQTLSYIFVHRTIYERFQAEKIKARQTESSGFFESPSATSSASTPSSSDGDAKPLSPLEKADGLHKESWELTLAASRSSARLVAKILDNDFMKAGGSELKELRIITSFLAELPVVEEGFHGKRSTSLDWTWSNKVREVSWLMEGIEQVGYGWGINSFAFETIRQTMVAKTPPGFPPFEPLRTQRNPSPPSFDLTELYQATTDDISAVYRSSSFLQPNDPVGTTHQTAQKRWSSLSDQPISDASLLSRVGGIEMPRRDFVASPAFNLDGTEDFGLGVKTAGHSVYGFYDGLPKEERAARNPLKFDSPPPPPPPPPQPLTTNVSTGSSSSSSHSASSFGTFPDPSPQSNLTLQQLLAQNGFHDERFSLNPSFGDTIASQAINGLSVGQLEEFVFSLEGGMDWGSALESVEGGGGVGAGGASQSTGAMGVSELEAGESLNQPVYEASFEEFLASFPTST